MRPGRYSHARTKEFASKHINPKLRRSLRIYVIISVVVLVLVVVTGIRSHANGLVVLGGLLAGIIVGVLFNRIYKISWDTDADHAIYKMDVYGIVLLVAYIAFDLSRHRIVELFISGNSVGATSLALLSGALYGRVLGTGRRIIKIFREEKVL